ncbi:4'-phosphopantetheinyl transferase family protein [Streptomyces sp. SP18CS02]|uniref:4'-phosphopantetheinyl transferase family protein n=1 Tax=Streptomyces sp. SP18CS02 TaxID=3002531 RepID=UPI002E778910|nr:4'-phosphopantetheinyl transferase superfamily protein [Streptomyces sp. SP18CS02]MEE1757170.1 4'-phosphopantetheinyl transferase superfamily protein [Streptomyces sp. SP18CS02]
MSRPARALPYDAPGAVPPAEKYDIPLVRAGECHVWIAQAVSVPALLDLLDEGERARHDGFLRDGPRALYLTAHALLRRLVAAQLGSDPREVRFTHVCKHCDDPRPHGKPGLAGADLEFSLSHSGDRVAVALSLAGPVGVDVERVADYPDLPLAVLGPSERGELDRVPASGRAAAFTRYWARKEAVLKATGDGLMTDPALLTVSPPGAPAALLAWPGRAEPHLPVRLCDLDVPDGSGPDGGTGAGDGYRAAVAVLGTGCAPVAHAVAHSGDGALRRPR